LRQKLKTSCGITEKNRFIGREIKKQLEELNKNYLIKNKNMMKKIPFTTFSGNNHYLRCFGNCRQRLDWRRPHRQ